MDIVDQLLEQFIRQEIIIYFGGMYFLNFKHMTHLPTKQALAYALDNKSVFFSRKEAVEYVLKRMLNGQH